MIGIIYNPSTFFEGEGERSLITSIVVVVFSAVIAHSSGLLLSFELFQSLPMSVMRFYLLGVAFSLLFGVGGYLFLWLIYSSIFHGISTYLGGKGDFKMMVRYAGWGFVPIAFQGVFTAVAMGIALRSASPPSNADNLYSFIDTMRSSPELQLAQLVGLVFVLWQTVIWVFAVKHAHRLSLERAVLVTLIPACVTILWQLNGVVQFW